MQARRRAGLVYLGCRGGGGLFHDNFGGDHLVAILVVVDGHGLTGFHGFHGDGGSVFIHICRGFGVVVAHRVGGGGGAHDDGVGAELRHGAGGHCSCRGRGGGARFDGDLGGCGMGGDQEDSQDGETAEIANGCFHCVIPFVGAVRRSAVFRLRPVILL